MLETLLLAFVFMVIVVAAMAVGVLFGRKPIAGSCGGMKALGLDVECEVCGGNPALCESSEDGNPDGSRGEVTQFDPTASQTKPLDKRSF